MMESFSSVVRHFICRHSVKILITVGVGVGSKVIHNIIIQRRKIAERKAYPRDTIILHQLPPSAHVPSLSPFPIKVELFLKINNIPYQNEFKHPMGPKGKVPWMTFNDEDIADSHFMLEFLKEKFGIDMNNHLTASEKSTAKAYRHLVEDHLYWCVVYTRWILNNGEKIKELLDMRKSIIGKLMIWRFRKNLKIQCWSQGIGRHSSEQIINMAADDIRAVSTFIGNKKYLMGDKICEEDLTIFGFLVQLCYDPNKSEDRKKILEECPNIKEYCERIKTEYWPDWESSLKKVKRY